MSDMRKAMEKLAEAAKLLVEHSPPGDELENAEAKVLADEALRLATENDESGPPNLERTT